MSVLARKSTYPNPTILKKVFARFFVVFEAMGAALCAHSSTFAHNPSE
jgi:hypothetical protein